MATPTTRTDQIAQNFYTKVAQILTQSRLIQYDNHLITRSASNNPLLPSRQPPQHTKKANRWFNLELDDSDIFKEDIKFWRQAAVTSPVPPQPMVIEFYLDTSELTQNEILVLTDENLRRHKVDIQNLVGKNGNALKNIMLESWQLTLSHPLPDPPPDLPIVYKQSITFFRSLYAYVRLLPAYRLFKRLRRMKLNNTMKIGHRFVLPTGSINADIGIDVPIIDGETIATSSEYTFGSIDTPLGVFSLTVNFRTNCDFHIDDNSEAVLSSKFIDMEENFFTPTVDHYRQEKQKQQESKLEEERRRSYPSSPHQQSQQQFIGPRNNFLSTSVSPHAPSLLSSPIRTRSPTSNTETELPNNGSVFPRPATSPSSSLSSQHRHQPNLGLNHSATTGQGRNLQPLSTTSSSLSAYRAASSQTLQSPSSPNRPNVTLISPFKSPSPSSSPSHSLLSPTLPTSPMRRSLSSVSLQYQRYTYASSPNSIRSLPTGSGNMLSSSVKSTSSGGSPGSGFPTKFSPSFGNRHEKTSLGSNSQPSGKEKGWSIGGRRLSKASLLTNKSDDTTSDRSFNSSFFASLDNDDDLGEFVKMVDSREPLKIYSKSSSRTGSVYKSELALSQFQQLREFHNNLTESMSNSALVPSPQSFMPPPISRGSLNSSMSSSSTTSMSHQPNIQSQPQKIFTNESTVKPERPPLPQPVTIPQRGMSDIRERHRPQRSSSLTSVDGGSRIPAGALMQSDNIDGAYSSFPEEFGIGELRRQGSSSSLTSLHRQYHYHPHQQNQQRLTRGDEMVGITQSSTGKKPVTMDDDDLLFDMNELILDERTSNSGGMGSSPIPSIGSGRVGISVGTEMAGIEVTVTDNSQQRDSEKSMTLAIEEKLGI